MQKQGSKHWKKASQIYKPVQRHTLAILLFLFVVCAKLQAQPGEVKLLDNINPAAPNSTVMKGISSSVYPLSLASPIALLATGYLGHNRKLQIKGWDAAGALVINTAITQGLKYAINRQRPYEKYPAFVHPYKVETDPSFPSGHTSTAFATAMNLSLEFKKWYVAVPSFAWAAGVGYSRLYLGAHYPTDVLAGAITGAGSAWLSYWLTHKYFK